MTRRRYPPEPEPVVRPVSVRKKDDDVPTQTRTLTSPARTHPPCVRCGATDRRISHAGELLCPCRTAGQRESADDDRACHVTEHGPAAGPVDILALGAMD